METWSYVSGERLDEGEWPLRDAVPIAREVEVMPDAASHQIELLRARNRVLEAREVEVARELDEAQSECQRLNSLLSEAMTALLGERERYFPLKTDLMAARDTIAKLTPTVPDTPSVAPNPFREFLGDRRRIGSG